MNLLCNKKTARTNCELRTAGEVCYLPTLPCCGFVGDLLYNLLFKHSTTEPQQIEPP